MYSIFIENYAVLLTSLLVVMVSEIRKVASGKFSSWTGEVPERAPTMKNLQQYSLLGAGSPIWKFWIGIHSIFTFCDMLSKIYNYLYTLWKYARKLVKVYQRRKIWIDSYVANVYLVITARYGCSLSVLFDIAARFWASAPLNDIFK